MSNSSLNEIINESIQNVLNEWKSQGMTSEEIVGRIKNINFDVALSKLLNKASNDNIEFFKQHMYEIAFEERIKSQQFATHQEEIWGRCFAASQTMYVMAIEAAETFSDYVVNDVDDSIKTAKIYTFYVLQHMHGRVCQQFLEILHLIKLGFADGAYARWRSMYELCCCADFVIKFGENVAQKYYESSETELKSFVWASGNKDSNGNLIKANTFADIQNHSTLQPIWKKQYDLSCLVGHSSPQGTFKRLSNYEGMNAIPVGQSDYGITTPAEHSAIMLAYMTRNFITLFPNADSLLMANTMTDWIEVIRDMYYSTEAEAFSLSSNNKNA